MEPETKNNSRTLIVVVLLVLILAVGFVLATSSKTTETAMQAEVPANTTMQDTEPMNDTVPNDEAMADDSAMTDAGTATPEPMVAGSYEEYQPEKIAMAATGDVVLFFHATWCPSCRSADKAISTDIVPEGLTILKLDYDSNTELRKKYGVTSQHTFVQVDAEGNLVKKWTGSVTVKNIVDQVQSA